MLALTGTNALAAIAFALIYAVAASRWLTQPAFLAGLVLFFVLLTALWVHVERSLPGAVDLMSRFGRAGLALVLVIVGLPAAVLGPLFAVQQTLPADAGFADVLRPAMILLLLALVLVTAMNVAGLLVLAISGLTAWLQRRRGAAP